MNRDRAGGGRLDEVCDLIAGVLGSTGRDAPQMLATWIAAAGLPGLVAQGLSPADHAKVAEAALASSSMKGNPVALSKADLMALLAAA
jgi:alcohol dehydrogenase class IV